MARRKRVYKKMEHHDSRYDSALVGRFIGKVMLSGKRSLAERIVYKAIDIANEGTEMVSPLEVLTRAVENAKPRVEVKSRRVGGATYQVPLEVAPERSEALAMRWIIGYARNRKGVPMAKALANEIKEPPCVSAMMCIKWPRLTAPLLTSAGNADGSFFCSQTERIKINPLKIKNGKCKQSRPQGAFGTLPQLRHCGAH